MRLLERRIGLLFALFLVLLLVAVGRATWLGGVRASELRERAVAQQANDLEVPARRGAISDRHGVELAVSQDAVTVFAHPFLVKNPADAAVKLSPYLDRPAAELEAELSDTDKGFVYLARKLAPGRGERVEKLGIEGIGTVDEPRRRYPQDELAAQLLGAVGTDNYGLAGIEQSRERTLHGTDGRRHVTSDAMGDPVSIVDVERALPGSDVELTIESAIQAHVEEVLADVGRKHTPAGATALVMDPRSGELLAMANWPATDANEFASAPDAARQNRAVTAAYEPGSTFKPFTVAAALEEELVGPHTAFELPPQIQVADRTITEPHERGTETLTVADILAQSSNVGAVKIGLRLGVERFDAWVRRFGFASETGIAVPGESTGIVPEPSEYSGSSLGNLPLGQGLAATPIQMAAGYAAIANGGVLPQPHLIAGEPPEGERVMSRRTAGQVARMLEGVVAPGGTASEASVPGYRLAGKTGTAEKPNGNGGYSATKFFASFIGFAPARDPRLLVAVMVDEPRGGPTSGGEVAAPAFEDIVSFALPALGIPPD